DFLSLEAAGWKGREGSAMKCRPAEEAFFREMVKGAFAAGQLMMLGVFLGGRAIALKSNLVSPPSRSFSFKIAYDESRFTASPGLLLEIANIEQLHQTTPRPARWMDSCAEADHFMINRLWTERRAIQSLLLATGRAPGDLVTALWPLTRWIKRI